MTAAHNATFEAYTHYQHLIDSEDRRNGGGFTELGRCLADQIEDILIVGHAFKRNDESCFAEALTAVTWGMDEPPLDQKIISEKSFWKGWQLVSIESLMIDHAATLSDETFLTFQRDFPPGHFDFLSARREVAA